VAAADPGEGVRPAAWGNTRDGRTQAWETSSPSSRQNSPGAESPAATSSRTLGSDNSPRPNASRVAGIHRSDRATPTRQRHTAAGSPLRAISHPVGEPNPSASGIPRRATDSINSAHRAATRAASPTSHRSSPTTSPSPSESAGTHSVSSTGTTRLGERAPTLIPQPINRV
jgi:hypothetical protein